MVSDALSRNNVRVTGPEGAPFLVFLHGFGTDQTVWRRILPYFSNRFRVILMDHVGSGGSDKAAYDSSRYDSLDAYVADLVEVCDRLGVRDATLVGHSVGSMMAVRAAAEDVEARFARVILLTSSPCYLNDDDQGYVGGFSRAELDDLFESLDENYLVWAETMAPVYMNAPDAPELDREVQGSFKRIGPRIAREFARVAFLSDVRASLPDVGVPTLVLQGTDDIVTPDHVGHYLCERLPNASLVQLAATGHFPQSSAPEETAAAMMNFLVAR